jgi:hypothetical protein
LESDLQYQREFGYALAVRRLKWQLEGKEEQYK